ncbi:MAG: hypothetical protein HZC49_04520 [Nitrospirae bacterium]|nr:hypothetical protein [Nitrospirota bacterium]
MSKDICIVCAWRATCQKMFSVSGRDIKCSDFVKDVSIKEDTSKEAEPDKVGSD